MQLASIKRESCACPWSDPPLWFSVHGNGYPVTLDKDQVLGTEGFNDIYYPSEDRWFIASKGNVLWPNAYNYRAADVGGIETINERGGNWRENAGVRIWGEPSRVVNSAGSIKFIWGTPMKLATKRLAGKL